MIHNCTALIMPHILLARKKAAHHRICNTVTGGFLSFLSSIFANIFFDLFIKSPSILI
jgi:hypothetical protein